MMNPDLLLHALLRLTLLSSAALMLLAALRPVLRMSFGARTAYAAWLLVPLMLASPWLPEAPLPAPAQTPLTLLGTHADAAMQALPATAAAAPATVRAQAGPVLLAWLLGALTLAAAQWHGQRRYQRELQQGADGQWRAPAGHSPAVVGVWPARLVLPADFTQRFDAASQRLMLAHEAVHQRRHDNAWNLLAAALLCLQWFNPLAWWGMRRMREDQELACDDAVLDAVRDPSAPATYARAVLAMHQGPRHPVLAAGWTTTHPLVNRMQRLAHHRPASRARRLGGLLLVGTIGLGAALLARAAQQPAPGSVTPRDTEQGLGFEVSSQIGSQTWQHSKMWLPMDRPLIGGPSGVMLQSMQPGWCLYLALYTFDDGTVRPTAQALDETCQRPLGDWRELHTDGRLVQLVATTAQGPLQAQVSARWLRPGDAPALNQADSATQRPLSAAQLAEVARQRAHIAQRRREEAALNDAWLKARDEAQPGTR